LGNNALDSGRKWSNELIRMCKMIDEVENWWDYLINSMNVARLQSLKIVLKERKLIAQRADRLVVLLPKLNLRSQHFLSNGLYSLLDAFNY
jgi:hypothetical protein